MSRDRLILIIGILAVLASAAGVVVYVSDWKKRALATVGPTDFNTLAAMFAAAEQQYGLPVDLLARQGWQESDWNPNATNPSGAQGIMQFEPATATQYGVTNPFDPSQAIPAAAHYMSDLYEQFGAWSLALAAYDAGPGNVKTYGGIPPYPETQDYVENILSDVNAEGGQQLT